MVDENDFHWFDYQVCHYCINLMRGSHRDGYNEGCGLRKSEEGKFARITLGDQIAELKEYEIDSVDGSVGCEQFSPSGVPAHPIVLERLIKQNQKCASIPSDPNATETSWDLCDKIDRVLPQKNKVDYTKIQ